MKYTRRIWISALWVVFGVALNLACFAGALDEYWSGMGAGFIGVGIVQIIRHIRYRTNEEYRDKVDTASRDERNKFLSGRAWAWAGYLFILVSAVATIGLQIAGRDELSTMAGFGVCLLMIFYWVSYLVLSRKY